MKILYIGDDNLSSTSYHRAMALKRIGETVTIVNPKKACSKFLSNNFLSKIHYHTGYIFLQKIIYKWIKQVFSENSDYDLVWVNSGELLGAKAIEYISANLNIKVILYNNDDPTGGRDGRRFDSLLKAIPFYSICVVMREHNVAEYYNYGAQKVYRVTMSYDELFHKAFDNVEDIPNVLKSEIAFIGTWMRYENRDQFLLKLIQANLPISIWGGRWDKSPLWSELKPFYKGESLGSRDYVAAIQGAKICLGMLSKGNRDLHTTRSLEIPYAKGLLCAERTTEHMEMYKDGVEAVFWDDVEECILKCRNLLQNTSEIDAIKQHGFQRVLKNKKGNEDICAKILEQIISENK